MIFAAGLGTRLKPLTDRLPKALVQVGGLPMLQRVLDRVVEAGCRKIAVNVHHFPGLIREFLAQLSHPGIEIFVSDESDGLLDTGGGLLRAASFLSGEEPVLVHNVDVISTLDLKKMAELHATSGALATLAVRNRKTSRYLLFDDRMRMAGWLNRSTGVVRMAGSAGDRQTIALAFSGIQIIDPSFFSLVTRKGSFSLIDAYLDLAARYPVCGYRDDASLWIDIGNPGQLQEAGNMAARGLLP